MLINVELLEFMLFVLVVLKPSVYFFGCERMLKIDFTAVKHFNNEYKLEIH